MEENQDAMMIYRLCQNQLVMAPMGGPVDIDHKAVHEAMRLYGVNDRRGCFQKVLRVAHFVLAKRQEGEG